MPSSPLPGLSYSLILSGPLWFFFLLRDAPLFKKYPRVVSIGSYCVILLCGFGKLACKTSYELLNFSMCLILPCVTGGMVATKRYVHLEPVNVTQLENGSFLV